MGKKVDIILTKQHPKLGPKGKIVSVALGYARNFLIPQGMAIFANKENLKKIENQKAGIEKAYQEFLASQKPVAEKLNGKVVVLKVKASKKGNLFGSVAESQIAQAIKDELQVGLDKKMIKLEKPIKEAGDYPLEIEFSPKIHSQITLRVQAIE